MLSFLWILKKYKYTLHHPEKHKPAYNKKTLFAFVTLFYSVYIVQIVFIYIYSVYSVIMYLYAFIVFIQ